MENLNKFSGSIIAAAIEVHKHLGPELLESAYEECLAYELQKNDYWLRDKSRFLLSIKKCN